MVFEPKKKIEIIELFFKLRNNSLRVIAEISETNEHFVSQTLDEFFKTGFIKLESKMNEKQNNRVGDYNAETKKRRINALKALEEAKRQERELKKPIKYLLK